MGSVNFANPHFATHPNEAAPGRQFTGTWQLNTTETAILECHDGNCKVRKYMLVSEHATDPQIHPHLGLLEFAPSQYDTSTTARYYLG